MCIRDRLKHCSSVMFADDVSASTTSKTKNELEVNLNEDMHNLAQWCKENKITFSPKTEFMVFHTANLPDIELTVKVNDVDLKQAKTFKYLGLELDPKLKLESHFNKVVKEVQNRIMLIARHKNYFHKNR